MVVKYAGANPIGFMNKYPGRVVALHLKDMTPDRKLPKWVMERLISLVTLMLPRQAVPAISWSRMIVQAFHHLKASAAPLKTCVENWNGGNASCHVLPRFERSI
jgi:hypothetical protein